MIDLRERSMASELMDVEPVDRATFRGCLRDLERINRWTGAYRITLRWLQEVLEAHPSKRLSVLDVGSGYGDMLRRIFAFGTAQGLQLDLIGIDLNPHAAPVARAVTPEGAPIRYLCQDVFATPRDLRPDVVISALFTHHLDDRMLVRFLRWMEERARVGWLINDLHRHRLPYSIARLAPAVLRMNRLVRHDAAVSVARSFVLADWQRLLVQADLAGVPITIARRFPFRFAVGRIK